MIDYIRDRIEIIKANQNIRKLDMHYGSKIAQAERMNQGGQETKIISAEWFHTTREQKEQIERILSRMLIRKGERLNVSIPGYNEADMWAGEEREYLNDKGRRAVSKAIRMETKEKLDVWLPIITAVTGLVGAVIGLLSVIK